MQFSKKAFVVLALGFHKRRLTSAAWIAFAAILGIVAYLALSACDLGVHPLFGLSYCQAKEKNLLSIEQDRERDLLDRLHQAQLDLARLPLCLPDPPQQRAENIVPTPTPTPSPTPAPSPSPTPDDRLTIPHNVNELKGCWQSVEGDIPMTDDDGNPTGTARICYCLGDRGRGNARYLWSDRSRCVGSLRAEISGDRLIMNHGTIDCTRGKGVVDPEDIVCSKKADSDLVSCDSVVHSRHPYENHDIRYRRVSEEYCR